MRFQRLNCKKEIINHFIDKLNEIGYKQVPDCTGGDQDFLMIDTFKKEYIWCENGFYPFDSDESMYEFEYGEIPELMDLKSLEKMRY